MARKTRTSTDSRIPELHFAAEDLEFYAQAILESDGSVCEVGGCVVGFIMRNEDWIN